jgi:hypothetical protein
MTYPTSAQRQAASLELIQLAEALGNPRTTFAEALSVARGAREDLARIVDAGRFATSPTSSAARPNLPQTAPLDAHGALLVAAEKLRAADPALSVEGAYAAAMVASSDLRAGLASDWHGAELAVALSENARSARIRFGEALGRPLGAVGPDAEYAAAPSRWAARGRQLVADGSAATAEIGYSMAMAEAPTATTTQRPVPAARTETNDGRAHAEWSARASELYKQGRVNPATGRAISWQGCYALAMEGR